MGIITNVTDKYQECIDICNRCAQACWECAKLCFDAPDVMERKTCISMLTECASICKKSVCSMSMDSPLADDNCYFCSIVCQKCAEECSKFSDEHCQKCADECKSCAEECLNFAEAYV